MSRWTMQVVVGALKVADLWLGNVGDVYSRFTDGGEGAILGLENADVRLSVVVLEQGDASGLDTGDGHGKSGMIVDSSWGRRQKPRG